MLSQDRRILSRNLAVVSHPVAAGEVIYKGSIVVLEADGFAAAGTAAANLTVVGHADGKVDNSSGGDGDAFVTVTFDRVCRYDNDGVAPVDRSDILGPCYIKDDHTVSSDATSRSRAGTVVDIDQDGVWISFPKV